MGFEPGEVLSGVVSGGGLNMQNLPRSSDGHVLIVSEGGIPEWRSVPYSRDNYIYYGNLETDAFGCGLRLVGIDWKHKYYLPFSGTRPTPKALWRKFTRRVRNNTRRRF